jgi:hypothetical protein
VRFVRENSLALFFLVIFLLALVAQSIAGHAMYNNDQLAHMSETVSYGRYIVSSEFGQAVMENWQSEYLQFTLYIGTTIWLFQRGSPESKPLDKLGTDSDAEQHIGEHARADSPRWARMRGLRLWLYSNSLLIVMLAIWLGSWFAQSVTGWSDFNAEQITHHQPTVNWLGYLHSSQFWADTLQNWQSELLAVGSMTIYAVFLRQRGSPESKPVGAPHEATGVEG